MGMVRALVVAEGEARTQRCDQLRDARLRPKVIRCRAAGSEGPVRSPAVLDPRRPQPVQEGRRRVPDPLPRVQEGCAGLWNAAAVVSPP
jgi:hypothetical protein